MLASGEHRRDRRRGSAGRRFSAHWRGRADPDARTMAVIVSPGVPTPARRVVG
ncbi:MAG TPA: hypothetical protein VOB72_19400 [Candidatus Dormibacteraeota bacterium]|nr:hypothetical protein [Candidatus Dormibacteraeota bacterium]